ncbi:MAG: ABC transporter permease subunit, partial [Actinobacteria bacterium]|nr:ABC transporter permease subunit [Actinomycetota bacterium]
FGAGGAMLGFALLATVLTFVTADASTTAAVVRPPSEGAGFDATLADLGQAGGLTRGFSIAAGFISLLVFVVFLTSVTAEYGHGTLRVLLTREPGRARLLGGKVLALLAATAAALLVAQLFSASAAVILAGLRDVPTGEWFSGTGVVAAGGDYLNALLTATFFGVLGIALGVLLRSTPLALGVGLAWLMPFEHIVQNGWAGAGRWFPGLVFEAVGRGGNAVTTYQRSLVLAVAFTAVAFIAGSASFMRRDVST